MSTVSKVVLGVSVVLTLTTVAGVHLKQAWDRQVNRTEPSRSNVSVHIAKLTVS